MFSTMQSFGVTKMVTLIYLADSMNRTYRVGILIISFLSFGFIVCCLSSLAYSYTRTREKKRHEGHPSKSVQHNPQNLPLFLALGHPMPRLGEYSTLDSPSSV